MADRYGATAVPLVAPASVDEAVSDPLLTLMLAFLKAFLQTDAGATVAWNAAGIAPTIPVVRTTHDSDPSRTDQMFRTNDLPALYMWRNADRSRVENIADCWRVETSHLKLLWIPPLAKREIADRRGNIFNGIGKAIDIAIERGRAPGFVVVGDPDPKAATQGSNVHTFTSVVRIHWDGWKNADISVIHADGSRGESYSALEGLITIEEKLDVDISRYRPNGGTQLTIKAPDGTTIFVGKAP